MKRYLVFSLAVSTAAAAEMQVQNPWVRAATGPNTAVYLHLNNTSNKDVHLTTVSSPVSAKVELHEIADQDGQKQMKEISAIYVPANGNVSLKPGDIHIMLMGLQTPLTEGQEAVPLTLEFSDGEKIQLTAPVKAQ
jgi:copper(I)-binding protein